MASLAGKADADQPVAGPTDASPQSAVATAERMVALARQRLPGAYPTLGASDLQRVRLLLGWFGAPVETVAAEIHQPAALAEKCHERLHHAFRVVFGVLCGDDDAIRRQCSDTFGMQVMI